MFLVKGGLQELSLSLVRYFSGRYGGVNGVVEGSSPSLTAIKYVLIGWGSVSC